MGSSSRQIFTFSIRLFNICNPTKYPQKNAKEKNTETDDAEIDHQAFRNQIRADAPDRDQRGKEATKKIKTKKRAQNQRNEIANYRHYLKVRERKKKKKKRKNRSANNHQKSLNHHLLTPTHLENKKTCLAALRIDQHRHV